VKKWSLEDIREVLKLGEGDILLKKRGGRDWLDIQMIGESAVSFPFHFIFHTSFHNFSPFLFISNYFKNGALKI
jgi:hypothetical protein